MRILFHGANARSFRDGIDALLDGEHEIGEAAEDLAQDDDKARFAEAEVIVGIRLAARHPSPANLKLYQLPAAGFDGIDMAMLPAGATLCNCFGHEAAITEYIFAALLARHVPIGDADRRLRQGDWHYYPGLSGPLHSELGAQTMGIVGFGHIGRMLAARAKAFGMRVHVANRSTPALSDEVDQAFPLTALDAFMGSAHVIVNTLPLAPETRGLIGIAAIGAMRADGVIVNVGRGPVIEEQALYDALAERRIAGAVIDTWYVYPQPGRESTLPSRLPFHELTNVVMTPHMSGWTDGLIRRRQAAIADNINRLAAGRPLLNVVRPPN